MSASLVVISEQASGFLEAAIECYGPAVLTSAEGQGGDEAAELGRALIWEVFGGQHATESLRTALTEPAARREDGDGVIRLFDWVSEVLEEDSAVEAATAGMLADFYRRRFVAGHAMAMSDLGDLLLSRNELDQEEARAAYRQAADAGYGRALITLARLQHDDTRTPDGARAAFQEAIDSADPDVSAEAQVRLGFLLERHHHDYVGGIEAYERAIETGHPHWAMAGRHGLAYVRRKQGDVDGARAAYQEIIDSGDVEWAAHGLVSLGELLESLGDDAGAKTAYWQILDSPAMSVLGRRPSGWAAYALTNLVNLLQRGRDLDGLKAAYRRAQDTANREAPYAVVGIGHLLEAQGDIAGARAAYQQAIDTGYSEAEDLKENLRRLGKPRWARFQFRSR